MWEKLTPSQKSWKEVDFFGSSWKKWKKVENFTFFIDFLEKCDILLKDYEILERGTKKWKIHKNL